jgi:hypothetical protein
MRWGDGQQFVVLAFHNGARFFGLFRRRFEFPSYFLWTEKRSKLPAKRQLAVGQKGI